MKYFTDEELSYIKNKYHDADKPFDGHQRFIRQDRIFAEDTGLSSEEIREGIVALDEKNKELSHPERKALAFSYVLENTRISCDARNIFPAINMVDRPLGVLAQKWRSEVFRDIIPEVEEKRCYLERNGIVTIWPDYDHSVPDWARLFTLGFKGILSESEMKRNESSCTDEENAFFEGIKITYTAITSFIGRLYSVAEKTKGSEKLASALKNLCTNPPSTFYEALVMLYVYFMVCEHIEGLQVRSLSGFDRCFYSFFENDIENGISVDEIKHDLACFFMEFAAIGNYWGQPVFLGGCKENEETEINRLSYLFLDVYDELGIYNPKIQIKIAESTPKDFVLKALDMIRRGHNSIVFVSDATTRKALENAGAEREAARECNIHGCYEYSVVGAIGCGMNYLNLLKPLEFSLHEGKDGITGNPSGLKCRKCGEYLNFEEFYEEYKKQLANIIDQTIEVVNGFEDYLWYINPQSMLSATIYNCIEQRKDAFGGGGVSNGSSILFGALADIADSLAMIKKYVFDKKEITLSKLVQMLDENFENDEMFRRKLWADEDKYGNNKELPDFFAKDIVGFVSSYVCGRPNAKKRNGKWDVGFHVARMSYVQGEKSAASPNGRKFGEEYSKNFSASMGQNREGITSAVLSATKIDATRFVGDGCLDAGFLPAAVRGENGLEIMYSVLKTFVDRGGHAIHINVFDAELLRDAQKNPEKHQDLQVRVSGWNVLWNSVLKKEQDKFIEQAEALK